MPLASATLSTEISLLFGCPEWLVDACIVANGDRLDQGVLPMLWGSLPATRFDFLLYLHLAPRLPTSRLPLLVVALHHIVLRGAPLVCIILFRWVT